jgi:polyisoprenyl-teichoic acid--peptidoglycan teichoic acid transferase
MHIRRNSTDGFVVRRRASEGGVRPRVTLDEVKSRSLPDRFLIDPTKPPQQVQRKGPPTLARSTLTQQAAQLPGTSGGTMTLPDVRPEKIDLDMNLDDDQPRRRKSIAKPKKPLNRKKIVKIALIVLVILLIGVAGFFVYKFLSTSGKIFKGNPIAAIFGQGKELKVDANGQTNVLLFGTSEDDPGHAGSLLTDSMMVASLDQKTHDGFLVSIPRDLYVDYGRGCPAGFKGKLNALYPCVFEKEGEDAAQKALRDKIGEVLGLDIQYGVHVNYTVLRQAVDAIGGITVTIDSHDPRGIMDRNFDWDCPNGLFTCHNVKYPNGPTNLNGKQALYLARARGANGLTYGMPQGNFDREKYQRQILLALKDKAVSAGTLTNPVAINNLLDALGDNVRTNFDAEEIKTVVKLGQEVKSENIRSMELNSPDGALVKTGRVGEQSIVQPVTGLFSYSQIQETVQLYVSGDVAALEKAKIDVFNAGGPVGAAQTKADELSEAKLRITKVGNAPVALGVNPVQFYDLSEGKKPETLKKLESLLGVKVTAGVPAGVNSNADFAVIIGKQPETENQ